MTTTEQSYLEAVRAAHDELLATHDDVFVVGEDVRKSLNNTTAGLVETHGEDRVVDAPISEPGFVGMAIGAAMAGRRPIVELQINTLPLLVVEQVLNHAQKIRFMSGGAHSVPITVTDPSMGGPGGAAGHHSDSAYPLFLNYGVKTAVPATPADAKGVFTAAVLDDDPVMVFFPVDLHSTVGPVPDGDHRVPLGEAAVRREGVDVTVCAIGSMVPVALDVATDLAGDVDVEVVDPRTVWPLDEATILESVSRTGRLVVAEDANRVCGAGAEIAAIAANRGFTDLEAPVKRVTRAGVPISQSPAEERYVKPDAETLHRAVRDVVGR